MSLPPSGVLLAFRKRARIQSQPNSNGWPWVIFECTMQPSCKICVMGDVWWSNRKTMKTLTWYTDQFFQDTSDILWFFNFRGSEQITPSGSPCHPWRSFPCFMMGSCVLMCSSLKGSWLHHVHQAAGANFYPSGGCWTVDVFSVCDLMHFWQVNDQFDALCSMGVIHQNVRWHRCGWPLMGMSSKRAGKFWWQHFVQYHA